ncbi:MAG: protein-export chaperone SecB [Prevotellaceae bacterium]|nr:protein-export chaperone SecB [Prevotellaceae bacterium]
MGCGSYYDRRNKETRTVTLTFLAPELLYDIAQWAYIEGDLMNDQGDKTPLHAKHETQDAIQDGNVELVSRSLTRSFAECLNMLYPYAREAVEDGYTRDDYLRRKQKYTAALTVPPCYSDSTVELLERLVHDYMVFKALWQLTSLTDPDKAGQWQEKWEEAEERINDAKYMNYTALRRPYYPEW